MCGIVGYTGPREAGPILIEGLQRLEYRGYDSAGIALVDDAGDLFVEKKAGKLANLRTAHRRPDARTPPSASPTPAGRPTAGPTTSTPIPHQDCTGEITVIHNGIIENFRELRDGLEARGHTLTSETDTEALAHLIEEAYAGDLADAVRAALRQAEGAYAIAVMHRGEGDRLVGARQDVPLVVGLGDGESFLASDVAAILAHTDRVVFLEEGDVADLRPWGVTITGVDGAAARAGRHDHRLVARGRREGRLRALHAQGDPRAARGARASRIAGRVTRDGPHPARGAGRAGRARSRAITGSSSSPAGPPRTRRSSAPRRSRPGPACRRGSRSARSSATARRRSTSGRSSSPSPSRRDGRHDRPDPPRPRARLPGHRGHQHRRLGHHPRGGRASCSCRPARRSRSPRRRRS